MCGINGIYGIDDTVRSEKIVSSMNTCLAHRGPDDEGLFSEKNICLGHRRLSIIDLSKAGHNPMFSNDRRFCVIHNGEIYNFQEIRNELKDYDFRTSTDTEVIVAAYAKWGKDCLPRFNGMFAFAIWDNEKKELFIARDRLGIKPLYYSREGNTLLFSSEIRSLLASGLVPRMVDPGGLADYLRYQTVHAPRTILRDVSMLLPGHFMRISENNFEITKYWDLFAHAGAAAPGYEDACRTINELLTRSVERRLIADVPFGAFLSGGIDSTAVVGLMSKVSPRKVRTFTVVFDEKDFSERPYAALAAKKFGTDHHEIELTPQLFYEELPDALRAMDHPSGDGPNTYVVSKATKQAGITMALSGMGGDELFGGYNIFGRVKTLEQKNWLGALPGGLKRLSGSLLKQVRKGVASDKVAEILKSGSVRFADTYHCFRQTLLDTELKGLLKTDLPENSQHRLALEISSLFSNSTVRKTSLAEISGYMQNVLLRDTDQMSMARALEVRVPFLDHTVVEYVLALPDEYKLPLRSKKLLIDSLDGLLPQEIIKRPKMGFTLPWKHWMKNEMKGFCEAKINLLALRPQFNEAGVKKLWERFLADDPRVTWSRVWHLVVLGNWMEQNAITG